MEMGSPEVPVSPVTHALPGAKEHLGLTRSGLGILQLKSRLPGKKWMKFAFFWSQ